jgi:polynucleotide 5'-kinase involved in rRNA processing
MLPDTSIDDVKKQRNAEYAKHIKDPVLSSLKMEGIRLLFTDYFNKHNFSKAQQ